MKKRQILCLITVVMILMIGVCGCKMRQSDLPNQPQHDVTLSERQKEILAAQGLPTDYAQLPAHQQSAIVAIEEMLRYAEEKYGVPFSYAGYVAAGPMEKEHLRAYPSSGHMAVDSFTITKTESGYADDFLCAAATPYVAAYVGRQLSPLLPESEVKVYAEITDTTLTAIPTEETDFAGKVSGSLWVFVDGTTCSQDELETFKAQMVDTLQTKELYLGVRLVRLKADQNLYLTEYNYTDYLSPDYYDSSETIYIRK